MKLPFFDKALSRFRSINSLTLVRPLMVMPALACFLLSTGCDSNSTVADFSASAKTAVSAGGPIFADFAGTCGREVADRQSFGGFSTDQTLPAECQAIDQKAQGIEAASEVVLAYFDALNSLASYNTATTGSNFNQALTDANQFAQFDADRKAALGALGQAILTITTSGYQTKHLRDDVVKTDPQLQIVLAALEESITGGGLYLDMLANEKSKLAARSKEFLLENPNSPAVTLLLDQKWNADRRSLLAKENAARAYVAALKAIADGHSNLAKQAKTINEKQLIAVLQPYVDQVVPLIPTIRNGF